MAKSTKTAVTLDVHGIEVTRYAQHLQDESWLLGVRHSTPDGVSSEEFISLELLTDMRKLANHLARRGFRLPADRRLREQLLRNLAIAEPDERCRLTRALGWHGNSYVLPNQSIGDGVSDQILFDGDTGPFHDDGPRGTLKEWNTNVAEPAGNSSLAVFLIATSLSTVLMRNADVESGIFHVFGPSGVGKTTLARVAVSVWRGGPVAVDSWNTTSGGFEELLVRRNDGFACFDEVGVAAPSPKALRSLLKLTTYTLTAGTTRRRSRFYAGGASQGSFRFLGLSTGEVSAAKIAETAGDPRMLGEVARFLGGVDELTQGTL